MGNSASSSKMADKSNPMDLELSEINQESINDLPVEVLANIFKHLPVKDQHEFAQTAKKHVAIVRQFPELWIAGLANSDAATVKRALTINPDINKIEPEGNATTVPLLSLAKEHREWLKVKNLDLSAIDRQEAARAYTRKLFPLIKRSWELAEQAITAMVRLPGNRFAVSAMDYDTIKIFDSRTGNLIHTLQQEGYGYGQRVVNLVSLPPEPDGKVFLASGSSGSLSIWDPVTGLLIRNFLWVGAAFQVLPTGADGKMLLASVRVSNINILDPEAAQRTGTSACYSFAHPIRTLHANMNWLGGVSALHTFSSHEDSKVMLANGVNDNTINIWDPLTGLLIHTLHGHTNLVISLQDLQSVDGKELLASGSRDNNIKIWDLHTGDVIYTLQGHTGRVRALEALPAGPNSEVLLASGSSDNTIKIWNAGSGECLKTIPTESPVYSLMYYADVLRAGLENGKIVSIHFKGVDLDALLGPDKPTRRNAING